MKLTPLLEERNNKPFMLQVQQRLIDDWDIEANLEIDETRLELGYSYEPGDDGLYVNVSISCELDGDNVLIDVDSDSPLVTSDDDQVDLNIEEVMTAISLLTRTND